MKKILLTILVVAFMAINVSAVAPTNIVVDYDNTYVDSNLKPGDSGIIQVVISNTGGYAAEDVQVWVEVMDWDDDKSKQLR